METPEGFHAPARETPNHWLRVRRLKHCEKSTTMHLPLKRMLAELIPKHVGFPIRLTIQAELSSLPAVSTTCPELGSSSLRDRASNFRASSKSQATKTLSFHPFHITIPNVSLYLQESADCKTSHISGKSCKTATLKLQNTTPAQQITKGPLTHGGISRPPTRLH
jgi:hypothetical protein